MDLKKNELLKAFSLFNNSMTDLCGKDYAYFKANLGRFFHYMESNMVLNILHLRLRNHPEANYKEWIESQYLNNFQFNLPADKSKRLSILYNLLHQFHMDENYFRNFTNYAFQKTSWKDKVEAVQEKIIHELWELKYKLLSI